MQLKDLKGIGAKTIENLNNAKIETLQDLTLTLPKGYRDKRFITLIKNLKYGDFAVIEGVVSNVRSNKYGKKFLSFDIIDESGVCKIMLFNFYPNQEYALKKANKIRAFGKAEFSNNDWSMIHPEWASVNSDHSNLKLEITPIYSKIGSVKPASLRKFIQNALEIYSPRSLMPSEIIKEYNFCDFYSSLLRLHCFEETKSFEKINIAKKSVCIEEMTAYLLASKLNKNNDEKSTSLKIPQKQTQAFFKMLPFTLTNSQQKVVSEIQKDINQNQPMNRLLQGDVGSGKTIVATFAIFCASLSNHQSIIMAPTEILATQHYIFLQYFFKDTNIKIAFLASKQKTKERRENISIIESHKNCIVVGTHALFQDGVNYAKLGLIIIDEQHRFGVEQRLSLLQKAKSYGVTPHQLTISATPIPRTLAMSIYNDMDISVIDSLPPNRQKIRTSVIENSHRNEVITRIKTQIQQNAQIYWICPLIEESESIEGVQDTNNLFYELQNKLPNEKISLVHGKMKAQEKEKVMQEFKENKISILVATTVIEVGVDVPNASIIIIENAERLGLSQLHQLRGRVGRGTKQSFCILLYDKKASDTAKQRLKILRESSDGFYLAQEDLKMRGAGSIFGKEQSGTMSFKTFSIEEYYDNYSLANEIALKIIAKHQGYADKLIKRWLKIEYSYKDV